MATLKEAINQAKLEPNSERAIKLKEAILSGKMDPVAQAEGLDLTNFKAKFGKEVKAPLGFMQKAGEMAMQSPDEMTALKGEVAQTGFTGDIAETDSGKTKISDVLKGEKNVWGETIPEDLKPPESFLIEAGRGIAQDVGNLAGAVIGKPVEWIGKKTGSEFTEEFGKNIQEAPKELLGEAETTTGKAGRGFGKMLGVLAGIGFSPASSLRAVGAQGMAKLGRGKLLQAMAGNLLASPLETAIATTALKGEGPSKGELGLGALIDVALPPVGKLLKGGGKVALDLYDTFKSKGVSPMAKDVAKNILSSADDGLKVGYLQTVADYKNYMKNPTTMESPLADLGKNIYETVTETVVPMKQAVGKELSSQISEADNLAQAWGGMTDGAVLKSLQEGLEDIGVKATDTGLDFAGSSIRFSDANQSMLSKVYNDILSTVDQKTFLSPSEKWNLAQALGDLTDYNAKLASQVTGKGEIPIVKLKSDLMEDVKKSLEQSGQAVDLFDQYKTLSDTVDLLNRRFSEGGTGGFSVVKSIFGEQKFGSEVKEALSNIKDLTGIDYAELAKIVKSAGEYAGDDQVNSLLTTTSAKGIMEAVAGKILMNKDALLEAIEESISTNKVKVSRGKLEAVVSATLKALGVEISD